MLDEQVVQVTDELRGQLLLVGRVGIDRLPRLREIVDEARERNDERLAEERGLRAEVTEEQVFGDAGRLGDLASRRAAVVLTSEQCREPRREEVDAAPPSAAA